MEGPPLPSPFSFLPIPFLPLPFLFPLPSLSLPSIPFPAVPSRPLPSIPPLPHLTGPGGITPGKFFWEIKVLVRFRTFWTSKSTDLYAYFLLTLVIHCRWDYWYGHGRTGRTGDDSLEIDQDNLRTKLN